MMRVVLAGCGSISRLWIEAIAQIDALDLVGMVDLDVRTARDSADAFRLDVATGTDLAAMIEQTRPDLVFDCTVPEAHFAVTTTALGHGCHVFGEKPMADSLEQARTMIERARDAGRVYAVMQNRRYDPNIRRLKAFLDTGIIGAVTTINSDFYIGAHFGGFRDRMEHVLLKDMAIHTFDAARLLSGQDPVSVYCHEWNPPGSWYDHDASAMAIFQMTGGVVFNYRGSWCAQGAHTSWEARWHIIGTKGSVAWDGAEECRCQVVSGTEGFIQPQQQVPAPEMQATEMPAWHAGAIRAFVDSLDAGEAPETICTDNIRSLAMVLGAVDSAATDRRLPIAIDPP